MPLFTKNTNKQNQQQNNSSQQNQTSQQQQTQSQEKNNLLQTISQCLPFLPLLLEQFTGQKIPQLQGTIAEMLTQLNQIQLNQTKLLANQEEIARHVENLESQAQQFTQQQRQLVKLTHERKEVEFNQPQSKPIQEWPSQENEQQLKS